MFERVLVLLLLLAYTWGLWASRHARVHFTGRAPWRIPLAHVLRPTRFTHTTDLAAHVIFTFGSLSLFFAGLCIAVMFMLVIGVVLALSSCFDICRRVEWCDRYRFWAQVRKPRVYVAGA